MDAPARFSEMVACHNPCYRP